MAEFTSPVLKMEELRLETSYFLTVGHINDGVPESTFSCFPSAREVERGKRETSK